MEALARDRPNLTDYAWAVGDNGALLATSDGGVRWRRLATGTDYQLRAVVFADPLRGWLLGQLYSHTELASTIVATSDGGETWTECYASTGESFYDLVYVEGHRLWAGGGMSGGPARVLRSDDGGASWRPLRLRLHETVHHLSFLDADNGWASTPSRVLQTSDGGAHWRAGPRLPVRHLFAVAAVSPATCWAVGAFEGQDAARVYAYGPDGPVLRPPSHIGMPNGVVAYGSSEVGIFGLGWTGHRNGGPGAFWRSANGGANWAVADMFIGNPHAVAFGDADHGWAVSGGGGVNGSILRTTDGGTTWTRCRGANKGLVPLWDIACLPGDGHSR